MRIKPIDEKYWPEVEGELSLICGPIGGGKTYTATADILRSLRKGIPVFASWPIVFDGLNEIDSRVSVFFSLFGLKRKFFNYHAENFHYIALQEMMDDSFIDKLEGITDAEFYIDEAYAAKFLDSYVKTRLGVRQRMAIYGTRHFNRKFIIVAQRPNAIHVSARAMVNRFYKVDRPFPLLQRLFRITFFVKREYQDMIEESVDFEAKPVSTRFYFAKKAVFRAYNSKYLRAGAPRLYPPLIDIQLLSFREKLLLLFRGRRARMRAPTASVINR